MKRFVLHDERIANEDVIDVWSQPMCLLELFANERCLCYMLWPLQMVRRSDPVPWLVQKILPKARVGKMYETCVAMIFANQKNSCRLSRQTRQNDREVFFCIESHGLKPCSLSSQ